MSIAVLSLGGSIVAPDKVDSPFLTKFLSSITSYLDEDKNRKLILVTGGGATARIYQNALKEIGSDYSDYVLDLLGIRSTHLNATIVKAMFKDYCKNDIVTNPEDDFSLEGQILVAGGWKPGFSTDTVATHLAAKFGSKLIINLSNIDKVYTDDPRKNPDAVPLDNISWKDFLLMVGSEWVPGKNTPFDPIASKIASSEGMKVICSNGRDIENTLNILKGNTYIGTTIS